MPQAVVHIGTPKTGTSSIQRFLLTNADRLAMAGFAVPFQWRTNHSAVTVLSRPDEAWDEASSFQCRRLGYGPKRPRPDEWRRARATLREELRTFAVNNRRRTLLFSTESLYTRLLCADVGRFRDLMHEHDIDVRILVYLRRPLSFRISQTGQLIRAGERHSSHP